MQWKRVLQLVCLAAVIVLFVGADTNQRFETLGHRMMCQCGCNQVLLECNHVGCTVSEQMRKEMTAALTTGQLPAESQNSRQQSREKDGAAIAGATTSGGPQNPSGTASGGGTGGGDKVLKASLSDDDILQAFVNKYGPVVLAAPTATGFNRVAWIVPYLALVLGFGLVAVIVKKWKGRPQPLAVGAAASVSTEQMDEFRRRARQETEL